VKDAVYVSFTSQNKLTAKPLFDRLTFPPSLVFVCEGNIFRFIAVTLLVKIADVLGTTRNALLDIGTKPIAASKRTVLHDRLFAAAKVLNDQDLELTVIQAEAIAALRKR
jgi:hypothetical protein